MMMFFATDGFIRVASSRTKRARASFTHHVDPRLARARCRIRVSTMDALPVVVIATAPVGIVDEDNTGADGGGGERRRERGPHD